MELFFDLLLVFLLVCAIAVSLSGNLLNSIIIYMSFSLVMSVIWILLESPDLCGCDIDFVYYHLKENTCHSEG